METEDDSYIVVADAHCRSSVRRDLTICWWCAPGLLASQRRTVKFGYEIVHQESRRSCWPPVTRCTFSATSRAGRNRCRKNIVSYFLRGSDTAHSRDGKPARS